MRCKVYLSKINIINYEEINHPRLYKENRHFDIHSPQLVNENYFPDINPPQLVKENSLLDINPPQLIKENSLLDVNPPQLKKEKSYNFEFDLGRCEDADIPVPHQYWLSLITSQNSQITELRNKVKEEKNVNGELKVQLVKLKREVNQLKETLMSGNR